MTFKALQQTWRRLVGLRLPVSRRPGDPGSSRARPPEHTW